MPSTTLHTLPPGRSQAAQGEGWPAPPIRGPIRRRNIRGTESPLGAATSKEETLTRWQEHYATILNHPPATACPDLDRDAALASEATDVCSDAPQSPRRFWMPSPG